MALAIWERGAASEGRDVSGSRGRQRADHGGSLVLDYTEAKRRKGGNSRARWRDVAEELDGELWPQVSPSFRLRPGDTVFTIGSCFARNIEANLAALGCRVPMLDLRLPPGEFDGQPNAAMNKFHPPAFRQAMEWTARIYDRDGVVAWEDCEPIAFEVADGLYFDLDMQGSTAPVARARFIERRQHVYDVFCTVFSADCLMMTPGLIEAWRDQRTGLFAQGTPYHKRMLATPERWALEVLSFPHCLDDMLAAIDVVRARNPRVNILVTTSPVPMSVTFTGRDITIANAHSKAVLRAVCDAVLLERERVDYFPSYEMVTLSNPGLVWKGDRLHVSQGFIGKIVGYMLDNYIEGVDAASADYQRARARLAGGDAAEAEAAALSALQIRPEHLEARILLGAARNGLSRWAAAVETLAPVVDAEPERSDARVQLARALAGSGRIAEAVAMADAAVACSSLTIADFLALDSALDRMPPDEASRLARKGSELFPRHVEVYLRLAEVLLRRGRTEEAIEALTRCVETAHLAAAPVLALARLLSDTGRPGEAISRLDVLLARDPKNKEAAAIKARILEGATVSA